MMMAAALTACVLPVNAAKAPSENVLSENTRSENARTEFVLSDSSKVFDIDEVVVVSQPKEAFRLRQQPLSSTSLGSFQIQKLGVHDLRELSQYIPNFVMPNYGSRLSSAMYVRGIGSRVNSPAVGIYLDGIPVMNKAAFNLHNYQLSRVDMLRGPQGTLYGQNTEGGLVKMYSRNPFSYEGTDVRIGYGSKYYRNGEVAHYQRINDHFAFSLAGFYDGQNGFFRNANTGERADKYNEAGGKLSLNFRLNKGWNINWLANYQYVDQNAFPYGLLDLETGKSAQPSTTFTGTYRRNNLITGLNINHRGECFDFSSVTSYQYLKDRMLMDQDYQPADYMHILQEQLSNAITQEFTFKSAKPVGGFWHWTTGAFFSYEWLKTNGPVFFDDALTAPIGNAVQSQMYNAILGSMTAKMMQAGMPEVAAKKVAEAAIAKAGGISMSVEMGAPGLYHTPQYNLGFYHESNFDITPRLKGTLGLRYDYMHNEVHYESSAFMAMTANVMGAAATYTLRSMLDNRAKDSYQQLLPKFGLSWTIDNNQSNIYATVSKGYRAGGYNIQMFSDILQTELNANRQQAMRGDYDVPHTDEDYDNVNHTISYKPETSWNYELGTHLNLFNNSLHLDLSTFYMQVRNQQLSVMAGTYGFGRMMVNAGKSHSCGIEASLRGQLANGHLDWMVNYGFTHASFDEYTDGESNNQEGKAGESGNFVDYKDKKVPYVPAHTLAAMVDYRIDIAEKGLRDITLGVNVNAQGKTYWDNANTYSQKFYAVAGAHADLNFGIAKLSLWARNLTNTYYHVFAVDNSATGTKQYFAQRGNPFQCGMDVSLHF